ncbi:hypothetical protein ACLK1Y_02655 [Escherichia coli]
MVAGPEVVVAVVVMGAGHVAGLVMIHCSINRYIQPLFFTLITAKT